MAILQCLEDEDIKWRAHWMIIDGILYRYRDFDWVLLLEIWETIGYALLLILRQYRSKQFIPVTQGLAQYEFVYKSDNYKKKLEEEKMQLGLDVDVQKLEAEKMRKGKNKAMEDLDNIKIDYKKLRSSIRTARLGKTSEQWRQEIKEEKIKADQWEKKFQDARV
ncbi:hypothetical protein Gohar_000497 [Gossypium harknessii]|uniref:Uncharacterized protein n=1 Tax=Gossypium harknessii TaxID=34285 RepID=A0A7J9I0U7_9ROSI|nr:hypothetical protein [Gossypium harknessii]